MLYILINPPKHTQLNVLKLIIWIA